MKKYLSLVAGNIKGAMSDAEKKFRSDFESEYERKYGKKPKFSIKNLECEEFGKQTFQRKEHKIARFYNCSATMELKK